MNRGSSGGCGTFLFLLFLGFLVAKVAGVVDWSWWWVTAPLWLPLLLGAVILGFMALMGVSLYRMVSGAFRRQDFSEARRRSDGTAGDILEAEGSEVRRSAPQEDRTRSLPAPASDVGNDDDDVGAGPAG